MSEETIEVRRGASRSSTGHEQERTWRRDADFLRRKWREDVTDPKTGLYSEALHPLIDAEVKRLEGEPWIVVKAKLFDLVCRKMSIGMSEHDWYPTFGLHGKQQRRPLQKTVKWRAYSVVLPQRCPETMREMNAGNKAGDWSMWVDFDHTVPDWDFILANGFPGMKARLMAHWKDTPFYRALLITADACLAVIDRFIAYGESLPTRSPRIEREIAALRQLRKGAPTTAYEALMFVYLYWTLSEQVDVFKVNMLAHVDQSVLPLYRADLAAGRTTEEEFREHLTYFIWQWGSIDCFWGQSDYIGGTAADGSSEYNEISRLMLDVNDELALPTPKLQLKIADNTPDWVWRKALDMTRRHRSLVFCGEKPMMHVLKTSFGCTDEEARTCNVHGCYEFTPKGQSAETGPGYVNMLKPVATLLDKARQGSFAPDTWDGFLNAYEKEMHAKATRCREIACEFEKYLAEMNPANLYSLSMASSVERGADAYQGSIRFASTHILQVSLGTTVDALLAVKEIVYERREMSLAKLGAVMAANWEGREALRRRMLRSRRKWGCNNAEANALGRRIGHVFGKAINGFPNTRGSICRASGHSAYYFIHQGKCIGATPDGRKAGDETSKNLSASIGADSEGATALINTLAALNPEDFPADVPLDVTLLAGSIKGDKGLDMMRVLVERYFRNGGCAIHFNIADVNELRDAQAHPEKYENLQVRVCGWNVRWNDLPKKEQDAYIRRAEVMMP